MKTKINRHRKGNYFELLVRKGFIARGYDCYKPVWSRWARKDIYGSDFLAYHPKTQDLLFVQVKSNKGDTGKARREFSKLMSAVKEVRQLIFFKDICVSDKKITYLV